MLRDGDNNLIALADICASVAVCDEIQRLRRILRKDDLLRACRTNELLRPHTRGLIDIRRLDRQLVCPPMRICVAVGAVVGDRLDDRLRLLRRRSVVEVDNGATVHLRLQDRKILQILVIPAFHPKVSSQGSCRSPCAVRHSQCGPAPAQRMPRQSAAAPHARRALGSSDKRACPRPSAQC